MKARFKEYLWEAMQALIRIGVLLEKSSIDWEKETITLVYNPDYATPKQRNIGDLGGEWNKNPFGK